MPAHPGRRPNKPLDDSDLERTEEYEKFMTELEEFHNKRGTDLFREPDLGRKVLDLQKLYQKVLAKGGYDAVTTEKGAWRALAQSYKPIVSNTNAGFLLKTIYYKYLAAFEIANHWKEEPPSKERLEDLTAAGGAIRTRTEEFYTNLAKGTLDVQDTPVQEEPIAGATPVFRRGLSNTEKSPTPTGISSTGRSLREAPTKRVLYQPEVTPSRPKAVTTNSQNNINTNNTSTPSSKNVLNGSFTSANLNIGSSGPIYQPQHTLGPTPRPVATPSNAPGLFVKHKLNGQALLRDPQKVLGIHHGGPPSIQRIVMSIKSEIPSEVDWGLNNLLEYTYSNDGELKVTQWAGLAEVLMEKVGQISELMQCAPDTSFQNGTTNKTSPAISTPSGELQNEQSQEQDNKFYSDQLQNRDWIRQRNKVFEAALCVRNLVLLEKNARYLAKQPSTRETLVKGLSVNSKIGMEFRIYCLEIIEQLATYMTIQEDDPLFYALQRSIASTDRGECIVAMRALSRFVIRDDTNQIKKVSDEVLYTASNYLLLPDEDIVAAVLDLYYQYTSEDENVDLFMESDLALSNIKQIARLLSFQADYGYKDRLFGQPPPPEPIRTLIPTLPIEVVKDLQGYPEPERASQWMRCSFEPDPDAEITQIALWQAYQQRFSEFVALGRQLLPAADFIKNVSIAFKGAVAMVVPASQPGQAQKFIIKGIKPRAAPQSLKGETYLACQWHPASADGKRRQCDKFKLTPRDLYYHILEDHLPSTDVQLANPQVCHYGNCQAFQPHGTTDRKLYVPHIRTHMPDKNPAQVLAAAALNEYKKTVPNQPFIRSNLQATPVDEKKEPLGVPFTAGLVLRNLARTRTDKGRVLFLAAREKIFEVIGENRAMGPICTEILEVFEDGSKGRGRYD